jgi:outer membrane murein-binding lipoprotein Lpp
MNLRLKRHNKLIVLLVVLTALLVAGAGNQRIVAYTGQDVAQVAAPVLTYSHTLAGLASRALDGLQLSSAAVAASSTDVR